MAVQSMGKCKNLIRSGRDKSKNQSARNFRVANARRNHLKNALRSCGEEFYKNLKEYYAKNPIPGKKV